MLFKSKETVTFNKDLFESAISLLRKSRDFSTSQHIIPIDYTYMGTRYSELKYNYKYNSNGDVSCVLFSLPHKPLNSHISCLVIGGANTTAEALESIQRIASNKYA